MAFFDKKKDDSKDKDKNKKPFSFGSGKVGSFKPKDSLEIDAAPEPGEGTPEEEASPDEEMEGEGMSTKPSSMPSMVGSVDGQFVSDDWACITCKHFAPDPAPGKCLKNVKGADFSKNDSSISRCIKFYESSENGASPTMEGQDVPASPEITPSL
jgi:hypothetical protein